MTLSRYLFLLLVAATAACTERLTSPGTCPAMCPGGSVDIRDTVLTAITGGDSSFVGYQGRSDPLSLLLSDGGVYGQSRAVIRFARRGDSVLVRDTLRTFTIDSVALSVIVEKRDTLVGGMVLEIYRLPLGSVDTTSSVAAVDALMTPAALLAEIPLADNVKSGELRALLTPEARAKISFVPSDSTRLQIGLRLRSNGGGAIRIGALNAGTLGPLYNTYVQANITDAALRPQTLTRAADRNFTVRDDFGPPPADLLEVGGFPAARAFIRFPMPKYLRDSATIIRATLELDLAMPLIGIPGDTARLDVRTALADFGAKSPVAVDRVASLPLVRGMTSLQVDVVNLVQLWQLGASLPTMLRLSIGQEGGTFLAPLIESTRNGTPPRLRITYRPPFAFEGL